MVAKSQLATFVEVDRVQTKIVAKVMKSNCAFSLAIGTIYILPSIAAVPITKSAKMTFSMRTFEVN